MNSLTTDLEKIVTLLSNDSALESFCRSKWKKPLTVEKSFKARTEVHISKLPIIIITRPTVKKSFLTGARDGAHISRFLCGFPQAHPAKILDEFIQFEEIIDDTLLSVHPETLGFKEINPLSSVNDEGIYKPSCFMVMEVELQHRRM